MTEDSDGRFLIRANDNIDDGGVAILQ